MDGRAGDRTAGQAVRRFWDEAWTAGRVAVLADILDPDWTENGEPGDVAAFQRGVTKWREMFPDFSATVEELLAIGDDRIVTRVTYRATHSATVWGLVATGAKTEIVGIDLFRVEGGRITELWHAVDHLELVTQMGGTVKPKDF
jgi:predicted ester cyclase